MAKRQAAKPPKERTLHYGRKKKWGEVDGKARLVDDRGWFIGSETFDIGEVYHTASQDEKTQEAYARLFVASPKLLKALVDLEDAVRHYIPHHRNIGEMIAAREAIAEATGPS